MRIDIITVHPDYKFRTVTDEKSGEGYERITFNGSSLSSLAFGAPAAEWIPIDLLAPSNKFAKVEIIKAEYAPSRNATLAPVPSWTRARATLRAGRTAHRKHTSPHGLSMLARL